MNRHRHHHDGQHDYNAPRYNNTATDRLRQVTTGTGSTADHTIADQGTPTVTPAHVHSHDHHHHRDGRHRARHGHRAGHDSSPSSSSPSPPRGTRGRGRKAKKPGLFQRIKNMFRRKKQGGSVQGPGNLDSGHSYM